MNINRERITKVDFSLEDKPLSEVLGYVEGNMAPDTGTEFLIENGYARFIAAGELTDLEVSEILEQFPGSKIEPSHMWMIE